MNGENEDKEYGAKNRAVAVRCSGGTPPRKQLPSMAALYAAPSILKKKKYESSTDDEVIPIKKRPKRKKKKRDKDAERNGNYDYERSFIQYIQNLRRNNDQCNCGRNLLGTNQSTQTVNNAEIKQKQTEENELSIQMQNEEIGKPCQTVSTQTSIFGNDVQVQVETETETVGTQTHCCYYHY